MAELYKLAFGQAPTLEHDTNTEPEPVLPLTCDDAEWGLQVNETALYQHRDVGGFWAIYRHQMLERSGIRLDTVTPCAIGDVVMVPRATKASAEWLRDLLISKGAPKLAVTVRRCRTRQDVARIGGEASRP